MIAARNRPSMEHYRKLERMYHDAPCNDGLDVTLSITGEGEAELRLGVDEGDHHAGGGVHGTYYFKTLDDATFFAANSLVDDVFLLTTDFHLQLTRPVTDGELRATATVVNEHPKQLIADGVLYDEDGKQLARGTGTFARSGVELDPKIGYE
jgi:uncharacterized protein (TIGR00369 family)